jgi:hypothetical protein
MRKFIAAMLLASAMAMPAYAQDHDHGGHGDGHQQGDGGGQHGGGAAAGGHVGNPQGGGQPRGGAPRGYQGGSPSGAQAQHFQPAARPGGNYGQDARGPDGRGARADQFHAPGDGGRATGVPRQFVGRPNVGAPGWQAQPGGAPSYDPRQGGRGDQAHVDRKGGSRGDGGVRNGARSYDGQAWNGGRPNGGNPGWGGNRQGYRQGGGGDWNRGWRQDRRYDWQGFRQQNRERYSVGRYRPPYGYGWGYRSYGIGSELDAGFFSQDYWISDPSYYRLPPAYGPYRWVRYYNDALMIDLRDGQVVDEIPNFFY